MRSILVLGSVYVCALVGLPTVALADGIPACTGNVEITGTIVSRIEANGVLITNDGLAVHMEGIRLPSARQDRGPGTFTDQAYGMTRELTKSRAVTLTAIEPKQDRYDRVRAQVFALSPNNQTWLQQRLLELGLARVALTPDRTECSAELYAAEAEARAAHKGIWSAPAYAIRTPDSVHADIGSFEIVEGKVTTATISGGRGYLNFGTDWKTDFTATISPDDMKNFDAMGVDPKAYAGKTVRVRGMVQNLNGPNIEIANPQGVEVVE